MIKKSIFFFFLLLTALTSVTAQRTAIRVVDAETQQGLPGAFLADCTGVKKMVTDVDGKAVVTDEFLDGCIIFSYLGYRSDTSKITKSSGVVLIEMTQVSALAAEIVVSTKRSYGGSVVSLKSEEIINVPLLLGEADPFRALTREPGISNGEEGNARIFVRGGLPSQNLILLDGMPIYNATHAGPLFSIFDGNLIREVNIHKITSPAEYGSGLSSLVEVVTNDAKADDWALKYSIGIVGSSFYANGPLTDKLSMMVGFRVSLPSVFNIGRNRNNSQDIVDYRLADGHFKLNYQFSATKSLTFQYFQSFDEGLFGQNSQIASTDSIRGREYSRYSIRWQNQAASLRYLQDLSPKTKWITMAYASRYSTGSRDEIRQFANDVLARFSDDRLRSSVRHLGFRTWLDYQSESWMLKAGVEASSQLFNPFSTNRVSSEIEAESFSLPATSVVRLNAFAQVDKEIAFKHFVGTGVRLNDYTNESDDFNDLSLTAWFRYKYKFSNNLNLSVALENTVQYDHGFSSLNEAWDLNTWQPSTNYLLPQRANQAEVNLTYFISPAYRINVSGYLRRSTNISRTRSNDITRLGLDDFVFSNEFLNDGDATSRGIETVINGSGDRYDFGAAYTLNYTTHQFDLVNRGNPYPFRYDRRHDMAIWGSYHFSPKWTVNFQWIYQTGIAVTVPVAVIVGSGGSGSGLFINNEINNGRFPSAHRLDLSAHRKWIGRKGNYNTLTFGLYNAYNNVFPNTLNVIGREVVLPSTEERFALEYRRSIVQVTGLFGLLPSITYRKEFKWKE